MTVLASRLDRVLFAPMAPVPVALFRVMLAAVIALVCWPTDRVPTGLITGVPRVDRFYASVFVAPWYWAVPMTLLGLFGVGVWPRAAGFLTVGTLLPLVPLPGRQQSRQVLLFTLLVFSFLRSDSALRLGRVSGARCAQTPGPRWPLVLIRLQLTLLYGVNALAKTTGDFLDGDVLVGLSRMLSNFSVDLSSGSLQLGPVAAPVWVLAVGTAAVEYALALGFWFRRLRWPTAVLGVLFHVVATQVVTIAYLHVAAVFLYTSFLLPFDRVDPARPSPAAGQPSGGAG